VILEVLQFPDPRLRELARPIARDEVDAALRELVQDMLQTMYDEPGIGLAAPQVGVSRRLVVMDVDWSDDGQRNPRVLLNPEIVEARGQVISKGEGCLSVPDFQADVPRVERVVVRARGLDWEELHFEASGLESFCFQHEIDHLDGKLFIDRISRLKRDLYVRRRRKQLRSEPRSRGSAPPL
jgi:peptide deformylase